MHAVEAEGPGVPPRHYSTDGPSETLSVEPAFDQAGSLHVQSKFDQAEQLYRAILQVDPNHVGSLNNLGILCFQQGRYEDAVALTREVVRLRPELAVAHNTMGVALRHLGRLQEAEVSCREALRIAPEYAEAHNTLGDVLTALRRWSEAEACCREALRLAPEYAEAQNNLGIVLAALGRPNEAENCYRKALRLKPGNVVTLNNLATVLIALRRFGEAAACCQEALRLEPGNADANHNLFIALSLPREISGEIADSLARATTLKPDFLSAFVFLLAYAISGDVPLAAGVALAAGLAQLGGIKLAGRRIEPMRWTSFALVLVLGGATILTQNPRFIMVKPSIVHFVVAALVLRRGWMIRYITPIVREQGVPEPVMVAAGYAWGALMVALGLANLIIALYFDLATWACFILLGAVGTKALQYTGFRTIIRRRLAQLHWSTSGNPNHRYHRDLAPDRAG
jgi:tetratricopeptide (TPR) repeat protein